MQRERARAEEQRTGTLRRVQILMQRQNAEHERHRGRQERLQAQLFEQLLSGPAAVPSTQPEAAGWSPSHRAMEPPDAFMCPITQELMEDPVVTADGHTFERKEVAAWLGRRNISPLTGEPLPHTGLVPNVVLRGLIQEFREAADRPET